MYICMYVWICIFRVLMQSMFVPIIVVVLLFSSTKTNLFSFFFLLLLYLCLRCDDFCPRFNFLLNFCKKKNTHICYNLQRARSLLRHLFIFCLRDYVRACVCVIIVTYTCIRLCSPLTASCIRWHTFTDDYVIRYKQPRGES